MNLLKTIPAILFSALLLTSCGGKDKKTGAKELNNPTISPTNRSATRLEGAWEIRRAEGEMAKENVGTVYEFKGNKLTFGSGSIHNPGTTVVTDSTFSFQADGNELKFMYNYLFDGDTLVVEVQNSRGQVFHMTKK